MGQEGQVEEWGLKAQRSNFRHGVRFFSTGSLRTLCQEKHKTTSVQKVNSSKGLMDPLKAARVPEALKSLVHNSQKLEERVKR